MHLQKCLSFWVHFTRVVLLISKNILCKQQDLEPLRSPAAKWQIKVTLSSTPTKKEA